MPWVTRGERAYLYKSVRVNGHVKSVYVPLAQALATHQIDVERREAIRAAQRQAARDRSIVAAAQRALHEAVVQELASAGYRFWKSSIRKKRDTTMNQELIPSPANTEVVGALVERTVLRIVDGVDASVRDQLAGEFARVRQEFGATATTAAERLLVEEISLAWLELYKLRLSHMSLPPAQTVFWARTLDSAQLRFLRATELLARLQRRAVPLDGDS